MIFKRCYHSVRMLVHRIDRATADLDYQRLTGLFFVMLSSFLLPVEILAIGMLTIGLIITFRPFLSNGGVHKE